MKYRVSIGRKLHSLGKRISTFRRDERGVTILEYGIIAALITVVSIAMIGNVGQKILAAFTAVNGAL